MTPLIQEIATQHTPQSLVEALKKESGVVFLRGTSEGRTGSGFSLVTARPFFRLRAFGSHAQLSTASGVQALFGNPWQIVGGLLERFELLDEPDVPFPLGACVGYWGYDLKNFLEPHLPHRALDDLELPDSHLGFYRSL